MDVMVPVKLLEEIAEDLCHTRKIRYPIKVEILANTYEELSKALDGLSECTENCLKCTVLEMIEEEHNG